MASKADFPSDSSRESPGDGGPLARLEEENAQLRRRLAAAEAEAERHRGTIDQLPIAIFTKDLQGRYTGCNPAFEAKTGSSRRDLLGKTVRDVAPPDVAEFHEKMDREMFDRPGPQVFEHVYLPAGGDRGLGLFLRSPLRDGEGKITGLVGAILDITQRKEAEEALRRSEKRLELILRHSSDGIDIAEFDPEITKRRLVLCNDRFVEMSGRTREELMAADDLNRFVHSYADKETRERDRRKLLEGAPITGHGSWIRPDGKENYYEWTGASTRIGSKLYVIGIDRDVTERKRAEEALRRSEESERYLLGQLTALHQVRMDLSTAGSFDDLCRQAIELGRSRLGFDRLGLWFTGGDGRYLNGSYGTDENGLLRDERGGQAWLTAGTVIAEVMNSRKAMVLRDDSPLFDGDRHVVGRGAQAIASLWDGEEIIGCLTTDNLLRNQPLSDNECEALKLYAAALGRLCSRQRSLEALRHSEELYRTVVESAGAAFSQIDEDGVFLFMNGLGARWLGMEPAQAVGKTMWELFPAPYAERQMGIVRQVFREGKGQSAEILSETAGTPRWFSVSVEPISAPRGGKPCVLAFARDVTERHEMEAALEGFNRRLRGIVENSWDVIFEVDLEGKYTYGNPAAERLTGLPLTKIIGMSLFDLVAPEFHEMMRERLRRRQAGQDTPQPFQFEIVRRDGRRVFVELVTTAVLEGGRMVGIQGIARDISDRLHAEKELRQTRERLEHLISASPAVIYSVELAEPTRIAYVSPNATRILGHTPQQLMDQDFWDQCLHPEDREAVHKLGRFQRTEGSVRVEYRFRHGDGSYRWMLDDFNIVRPTPPGRAEAVGHVVDITARKQAEEELRQAHRQLVNAREEERKRLASELHDSLGQQLISLHLKVQGLLPDQAKGRVRKDRRELDEILQRFQETIGSVRNISHGLYPPLLESLGLAAALREMALRLSSPIPIQVDCAASLEKLRWPMNVEIALFRVAQEALHNAVRHSRASRVKLALKYHRRRAVLSVRDDGVGFDPRAVGAGLGLSTMRDRAQTVGGELVVESRPGSTLIEARVPAEAVGRE